MAEGKIKESQSCDCVAEGKIKENILDGAVVLSTNDTRHGFDRESAIYILCIICLVRQLLFSAIITIACMKSAL